ncbi:hypothetical protein DFH06DRAFT_1124921 [Mycena polygramma]|nr:hypothetical protein DFH06DRAFT_1124921 [Mycena polygramma]
MQKVQLTRQCQVSKRKIVVCQVMCAWSGRRRPQLIGREELPMKKSKALPIAVALYTLSLVRKSDSRWYNILMIVLMSIGAIAASWNSWRWWKTYKQSRESLPYTMTGPGSSVPLVGK